MVSSASAFWPPVTRASAARAFSFPCLYSVTSRLSAERDANASRNCGAHTMRARILSLTDSKALKAQLVETQRPASFTRWKRRGFRLLVRRKNRSRLSKSQRTLAYHSENVSARIRLILGGAFKSRLTQSTILAALDNPLRISLHQNCE